MHRLFSKIGRVLKIKKDRDSAVQPAPRKHLIWEGRDIQPLLQEGPKGPDTIEETGQVARQPRTIHNPQYVTVEIFSSGAFFGSEVRVLELYREAALGTNIGDVLFTIVVPPDEFLPPCGEPVFPGAMPRCFRFPPGIAGRLLAMSPMVNPLVSALGNRCAAAGGTRAGQPGRWGGAFVVYKCKMHVLLRASQRAPKCAQAISLLLVGWQRGAADAGAVLFLFGFWDLSLPVISAEAGTLILVSNTNRI
jgi:hypothetical protein